MTLVKNIGLLGAALEGDPGIMEVIAGADCNLLVTEPEWEVEPVSAEDTPIMTAQGTVKDIPGGRSAKMSFKVGIKGSGTPGTAPGIGLLLRACHMVETVEAGRIVTYAPTTLSVNSQITLTLKLFRDGKSYTGKGFQGTVKFTGKGNEIHYAEFEFTGVYAADTDEAAVVPVLEITDPDVLLKSNLDLLEYHTESVEGAETGALQDLRQAAATHVQLAASLDNTGAATEIGRVRLRLQRTGAVAGFTNGIWVTIEGDAAGDPDGVPIGTSLYVDPEAISANYEYVDFAFDVGVPLLGATPYWVVLQGDYTPGANIVEWGTWTSGAGSTSQFFDAAWASVAGNDNFILQVLIADQANICFDGVDFDLANTVALRQCISGASEGWDRAMTTARVPMITLEPEEQLKAARDFLALQQAATRLSCNYQVSYEAGNIVQFNFPYAQIKTAGSQGDRDEIVTSPLEVKANSGIPVTAGNDEFRIRFS